MKSIYFSGFVFAATLLFYFLLRKYNSDINAKKRLYITLYIPILSCLIYFIFINHNIKIGSTMNEIGTNIGANMIADDINQSFMTDLFQSSVGV